MEPVKGAKNSKKLTEAQKLFNSKANQELVAAINQKKKEDQFFRFIFICDEQKKDNEKRIFKRQFDPLSKITQEDFEQAEKYE